MFKVSFKGDFARVLNQRVAAWESMKRTLVARLVSSPELYWWYFNEFGTATKRTRGGAGSKYPITPHDPGGYLVWDDNRQRHQIVWHPGTRATHSVEDAVRSVLAGELRDTIRGVFLSGGMRHPMKFAPELREVLRKVRLAAIDNLRSRLQEEGPRPYDPEWPRQGGKLKGQLAADVYEAGTQVIGEE